MTVELFEAAPEELGIEAGGAVDELLRKRVGGLQVADYVYGEPIEWSLLAEGGWDLLAIPDDADGGGGTLRDLIEVARAVGRWIPASPLITTMMAKRWSEVARASEGPVTVAVRTEGGRVVVPFGALEGISILTGIGEGAELAAADGLIADDFAPSLRLAEGGEPTDFGARAARELAVVWAAEAVGAAERLLEIGIEFVKQREQFGQPIGRFQAVKHHLANALIAVQEAEAAVLWAGAEAPSAAAALEVTFDSAQKAGEIVVQVHGGLGFTWELGLHMYLRHILTLRQLSMALAALADGA